MRQSAVLNMSETDDLMTSLGTSVEQELKELQTLLNQTNFDDVIKSRSNKTTQYCVDLFANETFRLNELYPDGFCGTSFDTVSCWPPTPYDTTAIIKCFSKLHGISYDDTQNATRQCLRNGTWSRSNYSACQEIIKNTSEEGILTTTTIYFVGYTLSLLTLSVAIGIFMYFKDLRCLRNTIHTNLMCAYMLMYIMWILTLILELNVGSNMVGCMFLMIVLHYFHLTTFFWMFVEGLYLYILVVETLTRENFKLRVYVCIGWGLPTVFVVTWAVVRSLMPIEPGTDTFCPWMTSHTVDWIHQTPTVIVLLLNLVFLLAIMWVLITKLRSANTLETQQYRKAAKALLVLMPLLGVTYVLTIYGPNADEAPKNTFNYIRAVLLSTQGFTVALFYCFLNTEVQNTLRHHIDTWRTSRSLGPSRMRSGSRSKDWSPRSRTESIRLYSQPTNLYHKRESCTSEMTTTTLVTVNGGGSRPSNGGTQVRSPFLHPHRASCAGNV